MFGEFVRKTGFKIGGALLQSDRFAWMLFAMRKTGIVRMVHVLCDYLERRNPTEEMLQYRKIAESHQKELRKIGGGYLADEESRRVYSDLFKYRCTKERKYLKGHEDKEIYFNKLTLSGIKNNPGKVFVDGGAFDGDTVKAFMKAAGDQFGHIFAFETEEKNLKKLRAFVDQNKLAEKITVYPYALWSERTTLLADDEKGMNQKVTEKGTHKIPADTIDHLLKNEKVSFIKMDIEGAEMEALKGAAEVIKANKPRLAISIYHKPNDFYEIPLYIMELVPEYRLYVRHHSCFFADTVLYAVI